jgi:prolipoprotein diacylglyceryltransferase
MTFPVFLDLLGARLHPHVVFETLAYFLGFRLYLWLRRRQADDIPGPTRWWAITAAALGGAVGSKVLAWLEDPVALRAHWTDPAFLMAGKTVVGGLLGGLVAVELVKTLLGERRSTGDLFAMPLAVGMAIGRIGCFLTGLPDHTYGLATSLPWGVDFGDGVARHPTQLYELVFLAALAVVLARLGARRPPRGDIFKVFMVAYLAFRLAIDALKPGVAVMGLTAIQWACLAGMLYYGPDIVRWMRAGFGGRRERDTAIGTA